MLARRDLLTGAALGALALPGAAHARRRRIGRAEIDADNQALFAALAEPGASRRRWQWIVIHHTAAESATLDGIDRYHRAHFGDPLGAEYHFVIGNGRRTDEGRCEPARWRHQELAAHLFHPERAPDSLALCLIGNFHERPVPTAMMDALAGLCRALMVPFGIPIDQVSSHRVIDQGLTACPGKYFDLVDLRRRIDAG
jgi:hypothetical protein